MHYRAINPAHAAPSLEISPCWPIYTESSTHTTVKRMDVIFVNYSAIFRFFLPIKYKAIAMPIPKMIIHNPINPVCNGTFLVSTDIRLFDIKTAPNIDDWAINTLPSLMIVGTNHF